MMLRQDRRLQIMQAAERLFTSRRFHEITTDDIAREAKVGKGTIYRYFQDKDDLFYETANSGFNEMCELLGKVPENAPFVEQLMVACQEISSFFQRRRRLYGMMQSEENRMSLFKGKLRERWLERRKGLISAIADVLRRGVEQGEVREDVPPEVLASFLLGMLRTRNLDLRDAPEEVRRFEVLVDLFRHGVSPAGGAGARQAEETGWGAKP